MLAIWGISARLSVQRGSLRDDESGRNDRRAASRPSTLGNHPGRLGALWAGVALWLPGLDPEAVTGLAVPVPSAAISTFGLGARPILFGLAFAEMARVAIPPLARWVAASPNHSERLWRAARIFALALASVQGMGIAKAMEGLDDVAPSPGPIFRLGVVVSILGATAFLIWLARIMTQRGIGDGMLVLLAVPFVAHLPNDVAYGVEIVRTGLAPPWEPLALAALVVAAVALLVASTRTGAGKRPRYLASVAGNDRPSGGRLSSTCWPIRSSTPFRLRIDRTNLPLAGSNELGSALTASSSPRRRCNKRRTFCVSRARRIARP